MNANTFGTYFQITTFGESHGPAMGVVIQGCPAGVPFSWDIIHEKMKRRRPGQFPWMSSRKELDQPELLSGVFKDKTLGTPIALLVRNKDSRSTDYEIIKDQPRFGHADDVWKKKFSHVDYRGGGRTSGRETVSRVLGGAVAEMFLKEARHPLKIKAMPIQIGPFTREESFHFTSTDEEWFGKQSREVEQFLIEKKKEGLSYGGTVEVRIGNPPVGLGQPVFHKLKSDLASAFMGIGSCYEVCLGAQSFDISQEEGSGLHGKREVSIYGGIRGGISTGEEIIFQLKFKPPASVLETAKKGRHDPCIIPRVTVVVESMAWLVMADHLLWSLRDRLSE